MGLFPKEKTAAKGENPPLLLKNVCSQDIAPQKMLSAFPSWKRWSNFTAELISARCSSLSKGKCGLGSQNTISSRFRPTRTPFADVTRRSGAATALFVKASCEPINPVGFGRFQRKGESSSNSSLGGTERKAKGSRCSICSNMSSLPNATSCGGWSPIADERVREFMDKALKKANGE